MTKRRILLVEDNRKLPGAVREMLELKGYEVLTAAARRAVGESRADLLVLDAMLPGNKDMQMGRPLVSMKSPMPTIGSTRCSFETPLFHSPFSSGKSISNLKFNSRRGRYP